MEFNLKTGVQNIVVFLNYISIYSRTVLVREKFVCEYCG
ncbi:hypothetical protein CLHUN_37380 [Ruminiclostridium hungatei]|uniref:Uncharacterized protein n=1 Tax=Ruminiclostridium hungatei TaxID=48256 RepID=A0A1V4SF05_RUMHU|nr:hypothetical protein CLHUN_37380 [Ruminiclostridium hungatei]